MNADTPARRPPPLIGGGRAASAWLVVAIAALSFLAALQVIGVTAAARSAQAWQARLGGPVTIAASGASLESADAAAARAAEALAGAPGVAATRILEPAPTDGRIAALMGLPAGTTPRLMAVTPRPGAEGAAPAILRVLRGQGVVAVADDHRGWTGPLEKRLLLAAAAAAVLVAISLVATLAATALATRLAVNANAERIGLLIRLGASDGALVRSLLVRVTLWATVGASAGALVAMAAASSLAGQAARLYGGVSSLIGVLDLRDVAAALLWPLLVASMGAAVTFAIVTPRVRRLG